MATRSGRAALIALVAVLLIVGGAVWLAGPRPLGAAGPVKVVGSTAEASFAIGDMTVRQVRYVDRRELRYSFRLANLNLTPVWVSGLADGNARPTLLRLKEISPSGFLLGPYASRRVTLRMLMTDCERLSARAGSLLHSVRIQMRVLGVAPRAATVDLPEALRLSSAREASCPRATSKSRSPG
ncbi:MAG: hypothetical protein GEU94_19310 [Micromonosporaceae bacterium]|nr:hypothetical protein [Micromonosporaceae bacterium]